MKPPRSIFMMEIAEDFGNRKGILLKFLVPFIILVPLGFLDLPFDVLAGIIVFIVLFNGTLGSSIGLTRMKEDAFLDRLLATPLNRRSIVAQYIMANTLMDFLQVAIPLVIVLLLRPVDLIYIPAIFILLASAAVAASSIGTGVAVLSKGMGDVHLTSIVAVGGLALVSGLFAPESFGEGIFWPSPFYGLDEALRSGWMGAWDEEMLFSLPVTLFLFGLIVYLGIPQGKEPEDAR
jgi:ABC-type transport system involved in cytochrome c biogenesis permease component